jgi:hypothetical protein
MQIPHKATCAMVETTLEITPAQNAALRFGAISWRDAPGVDVRVLFIDENMV